MPGPEIDEEVMEMYNRLPESMTDVGVYTKVDTLVHKQELVARILKSLAREGTEKYEEAINDDGETYTGVYWKVQFNFGDGMSLEETLGFKHSVENYDPVSMPLRIGYHGELKRIWFAADKKWQGFFEVDSVIVNDIFISNWVSLPEDQKTTRAPFQGFTYKVPEEGQVRSL